ncbi:protein-ADP-ribose hydrolase [Treponema peruense]|uniref:Protein-ADP-ribose hydrolase n=1 Tax=Treponema peruense TaxID=2787628 RepID=A0A7T3V5K4_9SPIR|nr:protein-ADP-ribose hydrolase [Treponema peruense]QQA01209.1 protein-ADP-ribose hydrolase [Treponema peruense]
MTQSERQFFLIKELISEKNEYKNIQIPSDDAQQKILLRSLMNIREAKNADKNFLEIQDEYLQNELMQKGITDINTLSPVKKNIYLWKGDITTLKCDAIVNAANSAMTGCYEPCHSCIDNCIHTFSGIQLRAECDSLMKKQGFLEPTGNAKITGAYNLPCKFVIHTVGPIIKNSVTKKDCELLQSCYRSCLNLAKKNNLQSIAFCCISTGVFCFPNEKAAQIAVTTVKEFLAKEKSQMKVVFNVFKNEDYEIYKKLFSLSAD